MHAEGHASACPSGVYGCAECELAELSEDRAWHVLSQMPTLVLLTRLKAAASD
jgi:hypothetical protein